jgi:hypothetical protein
LTINVSDLGAGRQYGAEVRNLIDQRCVGEYSAPQVANELVEYLQQNDPGLLQGFLSTYAVTLIRQTINERDRSFRSHNRATARRSVFRQAAQAFEEGDMEPLHTHFLSEMHVIRDGSKRQLKDMTASDLLYVAGTLRQQAHSLRMQEAFMRALAKQCGNKPVGEIYTEEQLAVMWGSIAGQGG